MPRVRQQPAHVVVPDDHKWCPECDAVKPITEFARNRSQRSGVGSYCRPCHNSVTRTSKDAHGGARNYHLRRRYGITAAHVDEMFAAQGGLCAICREAIGDHVDHDHATGRVRGLLCFNCNGGLGQFRDRTDLMLRAVGYLRPTTPWTRLIDQPGAAVGVHLGVARTGGLGADHDENGLRSA